MNHIVIGRGQIGQAVIKLLKSTDNVQSFDIEDDEFSDGKYDCLHVCFPYSDNFVEEVKGYIKTHNPDHIAIWSTVPIGTTKKIKGAIHTPVEGRHPDLFKSLVIAARFIGFNTKKEGLFWLRLFSDIGLSVRGVESSDYTEALKLLSTSEYGINLVFADYKDRVCNAIGMSYGLTLEWNREYNDLYMGLGMPDINKFILYAPRGKIGGHCVVPNAKLLNEQHPDELLDLIEEME